MKDGLSDVEFLQYIHKNAEMGIVGINNIINKVENEAFENLLKREKQEFEEICKEAEVILKKYGESNEEIGIIPKISTAVSSNVELIKDDSISHMAKMMIEGTNKGIIAVTEKINAYNNNDAEIIMLANKLKNNLEENVNNLKKYL